MGLKRILFFRPSVVIGWIDPGEKLAECVRRQTVGGQIRHCRMFSEMKGNRGRKENCTLASRGDFLVFLRRLNIGQTYRHHSS